VKFSSAVVLAASLSLIFGSCSPRESQEVLQAAAEKAMAERDSSWKPAPSFTLKDSNGAAVTLADYKGKVLLLNFWATWCGPCKIEIPWFTEFQQQYKDKGFEVLGVAMDDDWTAVKPYLVSHKINYRIVLGNDAMATAYGGVDALPTTFVIDQNGKVLTSHIGLVNKDDYVKEIEGLLDANRQVSSGISAMPAMLKLGANR
jgi:cytochrome c biogenesis protein CcmG/thiol:disulfide interchange protein DsbE